MTEKKFRINFVKADLYRKNLAFKDRKRQLLWKCANDANAQNIPLDQICRNSRPDMFCKKGAFRNFVKFLRTPFFIEHLWWLLLNLPNGICQIFCEIFWYRSKIPKNTATTYEICSSFTKLILMLECLTLLTLMLGWRMATSLTSIFWGWRSSKLLTLRKANESNFPMTDKF